MHACCRRAVTPTNTFWHDKAKQLAHRLRIKKAVTLAQSAHMKTPAVVGWVRPMILLPPAALTGLTVDQLQAILLHELAHIRRYDYLVNLIQIFIETLLFYHPALWWVSRRIRIEREHCCDDTAATALGSPIEYAHALTRMAELALPTNQLAVAANTSNLLHRVSRLLQINPQDNSRSGWITALAALFLAGALALPAALAQKKPTAFELLDSYADTCERLASFTTDFETTINAQGVQEGEFRKVQKHKAIQISSDGNRTKMVRRLWGDVNIRVTDLPKTRAVHTIHMWDGKHFYQYGTSTNPGEPPGLKFFPNGAGGETHTSLLNLDPMLFRSLDSKRVDSVIRENYKEISVADRMEAIHGAKCYVITAVTTHGRIKLWIAPEHNYHIAQFSLNKKEGDYSFGTILKKGVNVHGFMQVTRFEKIDGIWIPMESTSKGSLEAPTRTNKSKSHTIRTRFLVNPDHDALRSFLPDDIDNGTEVAFADSKGDKVIYYTWQDGKVVDKHGKVIFACTAPNDVSPDTDPNEASSQDSEPNTLSSSPADPAAPTRVLHFPPARSLGDLCIQDEGTEAIVDVRFRFPSHEGWRYFAQAQGDVVVPAGKRVQLRAISRRANDLAPLQGLGPDDLYMLTLLGWAQQGHAAPDDRSMQHIAHLTGLKVLALASSNITDNGIRSLGQMKSLHTLGLPQNITDRGLAHLTTLTSLETLYLGNQMFGPRITDRGLEQLIKTTQLSDVYISIGSQSKLPLLRKMAQLSSLRYHIFVSRNAYNSLVTKYLANASSLVSLHMPGCPIKDSDLPDISNLPRLESLSLFDTPVTDQGLAHLPSLPSLKTLNIREYATHTSNLTDKGMIHIAKINTLESLELPSTVTDQGLSHLIGMDRLKTLLLGNNRNYTDAAFTHISHFHNLEVLKIFTGALFTNDVLKHLTPLKQLQVLWIRRIEGLDDTGLGYIAQLTNLKELKISNTLGDSEPKITEAGLAKLSSLKSLESLSISGFTRSAARQLNKLTTLRTLHLGIIPEGGSALDLSGLRNLEVFYIGTRRDSDDAIRDADLACVANMKRLRVFHTAQAPGIDPGVITDNGLAYFKNLSNLELLWIGGPNLTDKGLSYLADKKNLSNLYITGNFTDAGLRHLENLKTMNRLRIYSSSTLSEEAKERLQSRLPHLDIFDAEQNYRASQPSQTKSGELTEDNPAPDFTLNTLDGKELKLSDYRGKAVILHFWGTWCRPCVASTPELKKAYAKLKSRFGDKFELISLSMDDSDVTLSRHVQKYHLDWPQARIGLRSKISADYNVNDRAPSFFLIGPDGKLLLTPESPDDADETKIIADALKSYSQHTP